MLIRRPDDIPSREITGEALYLNRREWLTSMGLAATALSPLALAGCGDAAAAAESGLDDEVTPYKAATTYNNYYEFGTAKEDPSRNAGSFRTSPWSVEVTGDVKKPGTYSVEDLLKGAQTVERTYRMRCVEAWSMVIPWVGVPLGEVIRRLEPGTNAKYVKFTTLLDPSQMPDQRRGSFPYPYVEGLRMDEALHPLTLLVTGMYGKTLPNQNGAPLRLVVPWKYGFKGIKAIVKMEFVERQPMNWWQLLASNEYGFYANVNPDVAHPRWSQARERRIGEFLKRPTLMFNGYADEVASLYSGMDLRRNF
jgi:sulfoxide reductase catalytic subunit YedY